MTPLGCLTRPIFLTLSLVTMPLFVYGIITRRIVSYFSICDCGIIYGY